MNHEVRRQKRATRKNGAKNWTYENEKKEEECSVAAGAGNGAKGRNDQIDVDLRFG